MLPYPTDEVDRIIIEESGENGSGPRARARISLLLLGRLAGCWQRPDARRALEAVGAAEERILWCCSKAPRILKFCDDSAYHDLRRILEGYEEALVRVMLRQDDMPHESPLGEPSRRATAMEGFIGQLADTRERLECEYRADGYAAIASTEFREMHQALTIAYYSLLSTNELAAFESQLTLATAQLVQARPLFIPPPDSPAES